MSNKFIVTPLLIFVLALIFHWKGKMVEISIFEMAMASLISSEIVAKQYDADPKFTNEAIGASILVSLATTRI